MQRQPTGNRHVVDVLFTLALFCVFAASSLMVVLIGANVYKNTVRGMDRNFETATSLTYVANKVRQHDELEGVGVAALGGSSALVLNASHDGAAFETWIYYSDGALRELLCAKGDEVVPENGQEIMELADFSVDLVERNLYRLSVVGTDGERAETLLFVSGAERGLSA